MKRIAIITLILITLQDLWSQGLPHIFTNVDTLYLPGTNPGHIDLLDSNALALVSSNPCDNTLFHFITATNYQNGKVIAIGHEGLLADNNILQNDIVLNNNLRI